MSKVDKAEIQRLVEEAEKILPNSYAPYSGIHVASAVLSENNRVYLGVNVENASYGLTICAERSAISAMISNGDKKPEVVVVVTDMDKPIPPCGACRQVIAEFNPEATIVLYSVRSRELLITKLDKLFPNPFTLRK